MKFKETLAQLKIDLEPMSFAEKAEHIWSSFKEYILLFTGFAVIVIGYIVTLVTAKDPVLTGYTLNVQLSARGEQYITQDFFSSIGGTEQEKVVLVHQTYSKEPSASQLEINATVIDQLSGMASVQGLDFVVTDQTGMELCMALYLYMDLTELLSQEELSALEGKIIYGISEGSDVAYPLALDITDTAFAREHLKAEGNIYIGMIENSTHMENCRSLWDYLMAYETKPDGQ